MSGRRRLLAGQERVYKRLGLVPDSVDVGTLLRALLEEQIIGYYDPATKVLYVVDDVKPELLEVTITHELVHALQDQYVNIDSIQRGTDNADRQVAAQAILEGQAVYAQLRASLGETGMRLGGWERARIAMRDAQDGMPIFASAPMVLRESLLFPYTGGADFMHRFTLRRPDDDVLADLPVSTRQLLNDAAYFGPEEAPLAPAARDVPVRVTLPAPARGTVAFSNVFGEFETRLILFQFVNNEVQAGRAAQGVLGDRYALIDLPEGDALVWASVWDSTVEAAQFVDAFTAWLKKRYPGIGTRDAGGRHHPHMGRGGQPGSQGGPGAQRDRAGGRARRTAAGADHRCAAWARPTGCSTRHGSPSSADRPPAWRPTSPHRRRCRRPSASPRPTRSSGSGS